MNTQTLAKRETQLPTLNDDPYLKTASRVATAANFLKYVKGVFVFGIDEAELALGTELVPNMTEVRIGWLKWKGGEVVEENMAAWAVGHAYREALGDLDRSLWEIDDSGKPIDPYSETATLPLKNPQTGEEFTFSTSSTGGLNTFLAMSICTGWRLQAPTQPSRNAARNWSSQASVSLMSPKGP